MFHVKHRPPHILLINPWITDFAAYNFWIKPLGLLQIAGFLRKTGFRVTLIDCLDFYTTRKKYGDGKFFKAKIEKPEAAGKPETIVELKSEEVLKKQLESLIKKAEASFANISDLTADLGISNEKLRELAKQMGYRITSTRIYKKKD